MAENENVSVEVHAFALGVEEIAKLNDMTDEEKGEALKFNEIPGFIVARFHRIMNVSVRVEVCYLTPAARDEGARMAVEAGLTPYIPFVPVRIPAKDLENMPDRGRAE